MGHAKSSIVQLSVHDINMSVVVISTDCFILWWRCLEGLVFPDIYIAEFIYHVLFYIFSPCNSGPHSLPYEYYVHICGLYHTIYQLYIYIKYCCITGQHCYHEQSSWGHQKDKPKLKSTLYRCTNKVGNFLLIWFTSILNIIYFHTNYM